VKDVSLSVLTPIQVLVTNPSRKFWSIQFKVWDASLGTDYGLSVDFNNTVGIRSDVWLLPGDVVEDEGVEVWKGEVWVRAYAVTGTQIRVTEWTEIPIPVYDRVVWWK